MIEGLSGFLFGFKYALKYKQTSSNSSYQSVSADSAQMTFVTRIYSHIHFIASLGNPNVSCIIVAAAAVFTVLWWDTAHVGGCVWGAVCGRLCMGVCVWGGCV